MHVSRSLEVVTEEFIEYSDSNEMVEKIIVEIEQVLR